MLWIKRREALLMTALTAVLAIGAIWTNIVSAEVNFLSKWGAPGSGNGQFQGVVGVAVAASVESVSVDAAAAGRDRRGAAQMGECGFGGGPVGVVAGAGQELAGDLGADTAKGE